MRAGAPVGERAGNRQAEGQRGAGVTVGGKQPVVFGERGGGAALAGLHAAERGEHPEAALAVEHPAALIEPPGAAHLAVKLHALFGARQQVGTHHLAVRREDAEQFAPGGGFVVGSSRVLKGLGRFL